VTPSIRVAIHLLGMGFFLWLALKSVRTGMPAGNPNMNPRRSERPLQFWLVVAFYLLMAAFAGASIVGF
jgi:threonine/homoserine/homoserine lactone efflux protein